MKIKDIYIITLQIYIAARNNIFSEFLTGAMHS